MQPLQGISKVTWEGYFSVRVSAQSVTELTQSKRLNKCWLSGFNKLPHQVQMDRTDFLPFAPDEEACFSPKSLVSAILCFTPMDQFSVLGINVLH